ncbi:hypothetical protein RCL1_002267 [Eukaryota sp. TZLM3-RCL]
MSFVFTARDCFCCRHIRTLPTSNLVLASTSKSRRAILSAFCSSEEPLMVSSDFDESIINFSDARLLTSSLSYLKAIKVLDTHPQLVSDRIVIGVDSLTHINGRILGKPKNEQEAREMLNLLSGNTFYLTSGITLVKNHNGDVISHSYSETTQLKFKKISSEFLDKYIATGEPYYSSGGYFIDSELGNQMVESINGCVNNVIGIGISRLNQELTTFIDRLK